MSSDEYVFPLYKGSSVYLCNYDNQDYYLDRYNEMINQKLSLVSAVFFEDKLKIMFYVSNNWPTLLSVTVSVLIVNMRYLFDGNVLSRSF